MKNNREYWEKLFGEHGEYYVGNFLFSEESCDEQIKTFWDIVGPMIPKQTHKILDFGCGTGRSIPFIDDTLKQYNYYGADICSGAIKHNKEKYEKEDHLHFSHINSGLLNIADNTMDCVIVLTVFLHITDSDTIKLACSELNRVMKKSASIIILDTNSPTCPAVWGHNYHKPEDLMKKIGCVIDTDIVYNDENGKKRAHWCCRGVKL